MHLICLEILKMKKIYLPVGVIFARVAFALNGVALVLEETWRGASTLELKEEVVGIVEGLVLCMGMSEAQVGVKTGHCITS